METVKLKTGDRVRIYSESMDEYAKPGCSFYGTIGTVDEEGSDYPYVLVDEDFVHEKEKGDNRMVFLSSDLELVSDTPQDDTFKSTNPKDLAACDRVDLTLWPDSATVFGALGMVEGDQKYGGYNFRAKGVSVSTYIAACYRHLMKYYNGEWADTETQVPHLSNALACLAIIADGLTRGNMIDDRPPKTPYLMEMLDSSFPVVIKHLKKLHPDKPKRYTQAGLDNGESGHDQNAR